MGYRERVEKLQQLSNYRQANVICYFTGDRENVSTRVAPDVLPVIYQHLKLLPPKNRIDLFLYTRGGDVLTPWRLVHLMREFADRFSVLVPYRAYSAGTLICLGADEIIMGKMSELSPIDPSVVNAFNPEDPSNPSAKLPVNVEDVYAYLSLAKEEAGLQSEENITKLFLLLAEKIHPLALGNVHRNYLLVRSLARKLLALRQESLPEKQITRIVDSLTEKLYAHNHMISRREAAEIGLSVVYADEFTERILWSLYEDYRSELALLEPFNPVTILQGRQKADFEVAGGLLESVNRRDAFIFSGTIDYKHYPEPGQVNVNIVHQGWRQTG
ncbi:MAG: hypothetical protein H0Z39_06490 [Peptococcaceae bacterium]|nr:hypothetical protein [Peptococcaceae bacterium]